MARPFSKVRGLLKEYEMTYKEIAQELCIGDSTFCNRMNCKEEWKLDEMYAILDMFCIPHEKLHEYFPKNGQNESGCGVLKLKKRRKSRVS